MNDPPSHERHTMTIWTDPPSRAKSRRLSLLSRFLDAGALARQRRHLAELDDAMLRDIGLTREQALREARRPRWDAPRHWQQ
jgi:uncharacterized protein YjiS (DUF1127 family)